MKNLKNLKKKIQTIITPITSLSEEERRAGFLKDAQKASKKWGIDMTSTLVFVDTFKKPENQEGGQPKN